MKLDKSLSIPLYQQLKTLLHEKIISGEWEIGDQLPTEQELADTLQVSRMTIKRAIFELVNEGLLYRQQGKGTFVASKREERDLFQLPTFSDGGRIEHSPHELVSYTLEAAGVRIAKALNIEENDLTVKLIRTKIEEGEPVGLDYTYLPYAICPRFLPEMVDNDLIYNVLKKHYGIKLKKAKIFLSPAIANAYEAKLLHIEPRSSVFVWERTTFDHQDTVVEYSKFVMRQDKAKYYLEVSFSENG